MANLIQDNSMHFNTVFENGKGMTIVHCYYKCSQVLTFNSDSSIISVGLMVRPARDVFCGDWLLSGVTSSPSDVPFCTPLPLRLETSTLLHHTLLSDTSYVKIGVFPVKSGRASFF